MPDLLLLINPDSGHLKALEHILREKCPCRTMGARDPEDALMRLRDVPHDLPDLILLDMGLSVNDTVMVLRCLKTAYPQLPVVVLISYGQEPQVMPLIAAGASDFISKPVVPERLAVTVSNVLKAQRLSDALMRQERKRDGQVRLTDIIGTTPEIKRALSMAQTAASSPMLVWLEGETGTGREWLARAIHGSGMRAGLPFVTLDAAQADVALLKQKCEEAGRGSLFIRDTGQLSAPLQQELLQRLDTLQARVICADSQPQSQRLFNPALQQRLQGMVITLPPLRQRREDIPLLAKHFVKQHAASENKTMFGLTEDALQYLMDVPWPGNICQLSNLLWRGVMLCNQDMLDAGNIRLIQQLQPAHYENLQSDLARSATPVLFDAQGRLRKLKSLEEEAIRLALRHAGGCMTRAARSLGIGRSTLYRRVNELSLENYMSRENQITRPTINISSAERS